jgi:hypothetical protein
VFTVTTDPRSLHHFFVKVVKIEKLFNSSGGSGHKKILGSTAKVKNGLTSEAPYAIVIHPRKVKLSKKLGCYSENNILLFLIKLPSLVGMFGRESPAFCL